MISCPILPDVQANRPAVPINLTRVGVTDVKKLVILKRENRDPVTLTAVFDIFVDLPADRKGSNLSRNLEAIDETLTETFKMTSYDVENICGFVAENLLRHHEYAGRAEVRMRSEYVLDRRSPVTGISREQFINIFSEAVAERGTGQDHLIRKTVGAEVMGMTACPCAQSMMAETAENKLRELGVEEEKIRIFMENVPMATHNQRGRGLISVRTTDVKASLLEKIIRVIEESMSSDIFEVLKRVDEREVVEHAHKNPKFVEDCVRTMAKKIVDSFPELSDDSFVTIRQINEESIHRHNAFAERIAELGDIRAELRNNA